MTSTVSPLMLPQDEKELAKLERHRILEEERKQRIFNTKQRLIGVDVNALQKQIIEKRDRQRKEELENKHYQLQLKHFADEANYKEFVQRMEKRKQCQELNLFRNIHQKKELSRDYDLEQNKQLETPFHLRYDDPRWGVQIFEGEDINLKNRREQQKEQQRNWLKQQIVEQNMFKTEIKNAQCAYEQYVKDKDNIAKSLVEMEEHCRKKVAKATAEYNKALASQKAAQREQELKDTLKDNETDIFNALSSNFLQENRDLARSSLGAHKYNTMMYKGMSAEQIAEIKRIQLQQIADAKARKEKEQLEEKYWERYTKQVNTTVNLLDNQMANETRAFYENLKFQNKLLGEEQKAHRRYMDKVVFTNEATPEFFEQFNKSTR